MRIILLIAAVALTAAAGPAASVVQKAEAAGKHVQANERLVEELAGMGAVDRWMRFRFLELRKAASDAERAELDAVWKLQFEPVDRRHAQRLKALLAGRDWFRVSEVGPDAERGAFSIVSHSNDLAFQKTVLAAMEPLVGVETPTGYANLYDRVAVQEGRPQRYATQDAACANGRHAVPAGVEAPDRLDERRAALGLEPIGEYLAQLDKLYGRC